MSELLTPGLTENPSGRRLIVDPTGERVGSYPSIASALEAARDGDRIFVGRRGLFRDFNFGRVGLTITDDLPGYPEAIEHPGGVIW